MCIEWAAFRTLVPLEFWDAIFQVNFIYIYIYLFKFLKNFSITIDIQLHKYLLNVFYLSGSGLDGRV